MDASKTDRGSTSGNKLGILNSKNFRIKKTSKSLPASSEINNQTVWRMNIKKKDYKYRSKCNRKCF